MGYTLPEQVDTMLKYFYGGDIELMIERVRDASWDYTEHNGDEIIRYLKHKQRKEKLEKIKVSYEKKNDKR